MLNFHFMQIPVMSRLSLCFQSHSACFVQFSHISRSLVHPWRLPSLIEWRSNEIVSERGVHHRRCVSRVFFNSSNSSLKASARPPPVKVNLSFLQLWCYCCAAGLCVWLFLITKTQHDELFFRFINFSLSSDRETHKVNFEFCAWKSNRWRLFCVCRGDRRDMQKKSWKATLSDCFNYLNSPFSHCCFASTHKTTRSSDSELLWWWVVFWIL